MTELLPNIRNTTRAIIIRDNKVLLLKKRSGEIDYFGLPGGGQDVGETLIEALQRECVEEIGSQVKLGQLIHVADYFRQKSQSPVPAMRHLVEFVFLCQVPDNYSAQCGNSPDKHQIDVVWIELDQLPEVNLQPEYLSSILNDTNLQTVYLGAFKQT